MSMSKRDLVLVHSDVTELPSGTRHWFPGRRLHAVHHVRKSEKAHYERLARVICRRAVGLVCSGGGSRGLAHMGSVQALHELSVPIDYIAGTSQGAFMGALYAIYGVQMDPVVRLFASRMGSVWQLLKDATLPVMSYFTGKTFSESIRQYFGEDTRIEDLWIPFVCVTTNLSKADVCVHRSGKVWEAVRASMSIVDYLPPMHVNGDLLIDGGYINNLPVDIMRDEFAPNTIIGVDVENKTSPFRNIKNYGYFLSGWWLSWIKLKSILMPCWTQTKVPRFSEIVTSLAYMNHNRNIRHFLDSKVVDVYIRPELGQTLLLDYHKYDEIRDIGYRFTKVHMVRWMLQNRSLVSNFRSRGKSTSFSSPDLQGLLRSSNLSSSLQRRSSGGSADASPVRPTSINRSNSKRRMSTEGGGISADTGKHLTFSPTRAAIERD